MDLKRNWLRIYMIMVAALVIFLISGCSGKRTADSGAGVIHLHADTLSQGDRTTLSDALAAEGFTVKLRDNPSPFEANTLIYQPSVDFWYQLEKIRLALDNTEHSADDLYLQQAKNHFYTDGHLGLYIHLEHAEPPSEEEVLLEVPLNLTDVDFASHDCKDNYILEFYHDGTVKVFDFQSDEPIVTLAWAKSGEEVTLQSEGSAYRYEKSMDTIREESGVVFSLSLSPTGEYTGLYGCEYRGRSGQHTPLN